MKFLSKCLSAFLLLAASTEARIGSSPSSRKLQEPHPDSDILADHFIVTLKNDISAKSYKDMKDIVSSHGATIAFEYSATFRGFSLVNGTKELLDELELDEAVEKIDYVSCCLLMLKVIPKLGYISQSPLTLRALVLVNHHTGCQASWFQRL